MTVRVDVFFSANRETIENLVEKHVLNQAAKSKDDEFYTYMKDIVKELKHYNFSGKIVYCCCDNPEWSNFYKYFEENFDTLGLKGLLSSLRILSQVLTRTGQNITVTNE